MKFTDAIEFSDNIKELIMDSKGTDNPLINIIMLSGETEDIDKNLLGWTVVSVISTEIVIDLEFESKLEVSQSDDPDNLFIQANLELFKATNGKTFPT